LCVPAQVPLLQGTMLSDQLAAEARHILDLALFTSSDQHGLMTALQRSSNRLMQIAKELSKTEYPNHMSQEDTHHYAGYPE
jgi:hypothetical protein